MQQEVQSSDSDSDADCETWDDSFLTHIKPKNGSKLHGYHLIPSCSPEPSEPPNKIVRLSPQLRTSISSTHFIDNFHSKWRNNEKLIINDSVELIIDPFRVGIINDFLEDPSFITKLLVELNELEWNKRSLDLYEFFQSVDLRHVNSKYIKIFYEFLKSDVKSWVQNVTGQELTDISATCSMYGDTDYLLVHDDQQEDRLIAFVFYMTGSRIWQADNGGALQLFNKDESGQPHLPIKDILPKNNQFVFFQVTNDSYHQVAEVTNKNECRISINGWFHTKTPPIFNIPVYVLPNSGLFSNNYLRPQTNEIDLDLWVNSDYLDSDTAKCIQEHIEEYSEISLKNYFKQEAFEGVLNRLQSDSIKWTVIGPPNRRLYEVIHEQDEMDSLLQRFLSIFISRQMFSLLKQYTDLDLTSMRYELQRWTPGCYSLLTDHDWTRKHELDVILYLGCSGPTDVVGGRIIYVSTDEEIQQALITLEPEENNLNIVYRDTARISKYVSKYSSCQLYYLLICSYSE